LIFGVLTPLSAISWRPVLVVEEAGVPGIVLSFLLRLTDSDCPFDIFKLFFQYLTSYSLVAIFQQDQRVSSQPTTRTLLQVLSPV
jgi:hypothetical protein